MAVEIPKDEWHSVTIELSGANGEHIVVKNRLDGASEIQSIEAETSILSGGQVGFRVGAHAGFRFDDFGTDAPSAETVALRYHYDAAGRVVGRTIDPSPGANVSQFFIYDEDRIVQELDGDGDLVAEWVYGDYIDEIFAMYRDTDADEEFETYYYIQDDLYNVVALTDEDGEVVERYSYDDYGMPTVWVEDGENPGTWLEHTDASGAPVSSIGNPFMFTGRRWDPELGLYDYRTRYYNPELGRFLRVDTIGPWGDPANLGNPYTYLGNNPWSGTDPLGRQSMYDFLDNPQAPVPGNVNGNRIQEGATRSEGYQAVERISEAGKGLFQFSDNDLHQALGGAGMIPAFGILFDATDSALYLFQGHPWEAGWSAIAVIPAIGDGLSALRKAGKAVDEVVQLAESGRRVAFVAVDSADEAVEVLIRVARTSDEAQQGFSSFRAFKRTMGPAGPGRAWHHIVEQNHQNLLKFESTMIHNTHNIVSIPSGAGSLHEKVSAYYSSVQVFTEGKTVRDWLSALSYEEQYEFGLTTLLRLADEQ